MSSDGSFSVPSPFTTPGNYSDMSSYGIGTTINLQWMLPEQGLNSLLYLGKDAVGSCPELNLAYIACEKLLSGITEQSWDWHIQEPDNYDESNPIYFLMMRDGSGSHSNLFTSHYINILPQTVLPGSAASPTGTASTQKTSGPASTAIGIGIGIGIPLVTALAAVAFFLYKGYKRRNAKLLSTDGASEHGSEPDPPVCLHHDHSGLEKNGQCLRCTRFV